MKIEHVAMWTKNLEGLKKFYEVYFNGTAGYKVVSEPRRTGDGYYESCILDPDRNRVEMTE